MKEESISMENRSNGNAANLYKILFSDYFEDLTYCMTTKKEPFTLIRHAIRSFLVTNVNIRRSTIGSIEKSLGGNKISNSAISNSLDYHSANMELYDVYKISYFTAFKTYYRLEDVSESTEMTNWTEAIRIIESSTSTYKELIDQLSDVFKLIKL